MPRQAGKVALALLLAVAIAVLIGFGTPDDGDERSVDAGVLARTATSFIDSIGVNTHTYYSDTPYRQRFATVERRLRELGVRHIRENLVPDRPDQYRMLNRLAAVGVRSTLILGEPDDGAAGLRRLLSILESDLLGSVEAVEGANEWDLNGGPAWRSSLARYQAELHSQLSASPTLSALPVIGPSLGRLVDGLSAPNLSPYLDYGNIHPYPDGEPPEANLAEWLAIAPTISGEKPVMATESGYHNALASVDAQRPTSEAAAAVYLPRLYLKYFQNGIVRTFPYELLDEFPDPKRAEPESNFGLLHHDLSPKPAFLAIRNLITILRDQGEVFMPTRLDYSLAGDLRGVRQLLLEQSDGRFQLALWRDDSVWDPDRRTTLPAHTAPVTLKFGSTPAQLREFVPNVSAEPRALPLHANATSVRVGPRVAIVEIEPG